jgi:hypothetical protein
VGRWVMTYNRISDAVAALDTLLYVLDKSYWDANTAERKDYFYDLIAALTTELREIAKLSVQDHHLLYEPITEDWRLVRTKMAKLQKQTDEYVAHTSTSTQLQHALADVLPLFSR